LEGDGIEELEIGCGVGGGGVGVGEADNADNGWAAAKRGAEDAVKGLMDQGLRD
jgi:hypothetical protein